MSSEAVVNTIQKSKVIAILRGITADAVMDTMEAFYAGGIRAVEVTFNTAGASEMIRRVAEKYGSKLHIGAGTVLNQEAALKAMDSGAEFVVAPNADPGVIAIVKKYGKVMIPGAFTPTEIVCCHNFGADMIKVFPVSSVGPQYIKDLRGPLDNLCLVPVGGVDLGNAAAFVRAGADAIGVGSSLVRADLIAKRDFSALAELAAQFVQAVR